MSLSPTSSSSAPSVAYFQSLSPQEKRARIAEKEARVQALKDQKAKEESARVKAMKQRELERESQRKSHYQELVQQNKRQFTNFITQKRQEKSTINNGRNGGNNQINHNNRIIDDHGEMPKHQPVKVGFMFTECRGALKGLKVTDITRDGAAYKAGIEIGDIIKSISNKLIQSVEDYAYVARNFQPRQTIPFIIYRGGATITCLVHFSGALLGQQTIKAGGANQVRARRASVNNPVTGKVVGIQNQNQFNNNQQQQQQQQVEDANYLDNNNNDDGNEQQEEYIDDQQNQENHEAEQEQQETETEETVELEEFDEENGEEEEVRNELEEDQNNYHGES